MSAYSDGGVSEFGEKASWRRAPGGREGKAFSTCGSEPLGAAGACRGAVFAFLRRLAISDSWQLMQKIPWEVRA